MTFDVGTDIDVDNSPRQQPLPPQAAAVPALATSRTSASRSRSLARVPADRDLAVLARRRRYTSPFLANYGLINVNDALLRVKGVGDIRNFGSSDYALRIWLAPERLARLSLTVTDVQNAIRAQNVVNPAGQIGGEPSPNGQQITYTVRAQGRLVEPEEFGNIIIREEADGSTVRVRDVARVELGSLNYQQDGTFNGKPAAVVAAFQAPGSNSLQVARDIKATWRWRSCRSGSQQGIACWRSRSSTTRRVTAGIREIVETLVEAVLLVVLVVFIFLQSWRATLIPLPSRVPVSLVGVFVLFPLLGFSVNTLSLFGLVLAIGLVVDDAIVVVEAVEHHIEEGMAPREATLAAMKQVQGPVIAIALILAAVFIPVAFMSGVTGRLYQQFALTIAISVLISAFNALTLSPALAALLLQPPGPSGAVCSAGSAICSTAASRARPTATSASIGGSSASS